MAHALKGVIPTASSLTPRSQELRRNMTKQERRLWYDFLKDLPVTVNRQKVIGNFIVDFYCDCKKLVIEVDGSQHYNEDGLQRDKERTAYLEGAGLSVVRIPNSEIDRNFQAVCEYLGRLLLTPDAIS